MVEIGSAAGRMTQPPLSRLTGQRLIEVAPDATALEMPLTRWRCSPVVSSEVRDADGKPMAIATGSAMVLPGRAASLRIPSREAE